VPAIAEPCAGQASDLAYSRVCETVQLQLVRHASSDAAVRAALPDQRDALIDALAAQPIDPPDEASPQNLCLTLARLHGVHVKKDGQTWQITIADIDLHVRETLLSTSALQSLVMPALDTPAPPAGPMPLQDQATATGDQITVPFDQPLAQASVLGGVFTVTQFDETSGWSVFSVTDASYAEAAGQPPTVTLKLDRALTAGQLIRVGINGGGATPLLGANLIPAGATRADREGRAITLTIH